MVFFDAESLEALPPVAYAADMCHCGHPGWQVHAITDCSMQPISFMLIGPRGTDTYAQANDIAVTLREAVASYAEREDA